MAVDRSCWGRVPIGISHYLRSCTPQVGIGNNHAFQHTFNRLGHGIFANPFSPHLHHAVTQTGSPSRANTHGAVPVSLQVFLLVKDFSFFVFEGSASNENFEESYSERPDIGLSGVVRESTRTLRGEILKERLYELHNMDA